MQNSEISQRSWPSSGKAWYAVSVLLVAFIFSFIDRIIIALLVEPIKADLGISDFGIGMLQGLAFAVFYAFIGIPIGRWADHHSRRQIITIGIFLWSLMTAVCGLARNFWQLLLARAGVGVGTAALSPAAYSMIADYFPREKLGRALGVYQAGAFVGAGLAFLVGGLVIRFVMSSDGLVLPLIGNVQPWQMVFFAVGLPGILVALLMYTVDEPERRGGLVGQKQSLPLSAATAYVGQHRRFFLSHFCGFALLAVPITTILTWVPAYYTRVLGYSLPQTGLTLGAILIILSPAGVYTGGWLVDTLQKRGYADATFRVGITAGILLLPLSLLATSGSNPTIALWLFAPFVFCASLSLAVAPATLQLVVPNQLRAQISATWMLVLNIVTAGIGPTAVGFISSYLIDDPMAVGRSIAMVNCLSMPIAIFALWSGLRYLRRAVAAL
ncbi:MAG TPA: MFS transporter [Gammaproteobacteria bacterium]|jgi:MFS family permease|nr:MFS transporter [Chromatiales bacterium]MDP7296956.1 MFS transporter [Gammaproteobacteria bacterium]MDP7660892.1 MFS transporter [Gammaproteobacteria bacterium]HJP38753.1 MFS transporter [Gammaproteobacteria bacterium]